MKLTKAALGVLMSAAFLGCQAKTEIQASNVAEASPTEAIKVKTTARGKESCQSVEGIEAFLSSNTPPLLIIGEVHGRTGAPTLIKAILCHSLQRGLKTHLALELPKERESYARAFIRSDGGRAARQNILSDSRWLSLGDGRRSDATFALLEYLREQRLNYMACSHGMQAIKLSYFGPSTEQLKALSANEYFGREYEITLKDNLIKAFEAQKSDKMIVLAGNLHASRSVTKFGDEEFKTMASYLSPNMALTFDMDVNLNPVMKMRLTSKDDNRFNGVYVVVNDDAAQAVPSPFR